MSHATLQAFHYSHKASSVIHPHPSSVISSMASLADHETTINALLASLNLPPLRGPVATVFHRAYFLTIPPNETAPSVASHHLSRI